MENGHKNTERVTRRCVTDRWIETFKKTGKGWLMITSGSMIPVIQVGDLVYIEKTSPSRIYVGDIITFWKGEKLIVHRVINKVRKDKEIFFIERADRNPEYSLVASKAVMGKVKSLKRNKKNYILDNLRWNIFNRGVGAIFFCTYNIRIIYRENHFFPMSIKNSVKKVLKSMRGLREKLLSNILLKK